MIIANKKRQENIAEYILYMWQIEDLIRSMDFDFKKIEENIISNFKQDEQTLENIRSWYKQIVHEMNREQLQQTGHLKRNQEEIEKLIAFHKTMVEKNEDAKYMELYSWAKPVLEEIRKKSNNTTLHDIEVCLNGLYGYLMLKLRNVTITEETRSGISTISGFIGYLSLKYKNIS
jgi:hypothetical protein